MLADPAYYYTLNTMALHSNFFLLLILYLSACSAPQNVSSQEQPVKPLPAQTQVADTNAIDNQNWEETVVQTRREAYSTALEYLISASQQYPDTEPVLQSLLAHPDQTFEMFEGCSNYWRNFEPPNGQYSEDWNHDNILSHYQNFPRMAQYTRVYSVAPAKHLVVMTCWVGPYWAATENYLYDETPSTPQVRSLVLPTYDSKTEQVISSPSNINYGLQSYDEQSRTLTLFHKYSGIGDCGHQATYLLENDEFILTEFREQRECDGTRLPGDFPQVYP
jgi:Protein of unknown function (DUF1176)